MLADAFDIFDDVIISEAQHRPAKILEICGPILVVTDCIRIVMLSTIDFDDDAMGRTGEIDDVAADGDLAAEAEVHEAVGTHGIPEF